MIIPSVVNLAGRWVPPLERSRFMTICWAGFIVGYIATFSISGLLCAYGFDRGWGSIFYTFGIAGSLFLLCWFYFVYDTPDDHPRISQDERNFLERELGKLEKRNERKQATPWLSILSSPAFWGVTIAAVGEDLGTYTFQLGLIIYTKDVLRYNIAQNGFLSSLPYIANFVFGYGPGFLADFVQKQRLLSTVNTRRLFETIAYTGTGAFVVAMGFVSCENRTMASVYLTLSMVFGSFSRGGHVPNMTEFAPRYAGEIVGMLNTVGASSGFAAPLIIGLLTPNGTQEEWRNVFYVIGAVSMFSAVGFAVLVRSDVQSWAKVTKLDHEVTAQMVPANGPSTNNNRKNLTTKFQTRPAGVTL